jgi:hypothetical protein
LNRAVSAGGLSFSKILGRCPRLEVKLRIRREGNLTDWKKLLEFSRSTVKLESRIAAESWAAI